MREGIGFTILRTRAVREVEVKPGEKFRPEGLLGVEALGRMEISEVLMVCPY